ncbi:uncharacterized protein LOC142357467, partial [Convolutriloba macropyga]|uniref:uncharacterized protein LOC142357467 n=1 Tax=Convolutriloba macropyga TaxID=536237 RepID=UPI003F51F7EF
MKNKDFKFVLLLFGLLAIITSRQLLVKPPCFNLSSVANPILNGSGLQNTKTEESKEVSIHILSYTHRGAPQEHMRELWYDGNLRQECKLHFDCIYKHRNTINVTAHMFYSMDAVIVGYKTVQTLKSNRDFHEDVSDKQYFIIVYGY